VSRFKLYIEYEGTRYSGWQIQKNSKTVQGILINTAKEIFKNEKIDIQGSGRTDSGVHALIQVAHLDVKTVLAPEIIRMKFNDLLPHDINILDVEKTAKDFHARHDAEKRSYIYQISKRRTAFGKNYVWWIKDKLDINAMREASKIFIGMHDFVSFTDNEKTEKSTKALIEDLIIKETGSLILIRITGSHFLWKMVRRIVGILVEAGRGKLSKSDIEKYLTGSSNEPSKYTAPPSGLFLEKVLYKGEKLDTELTPVLDISYLNK
jgi:tRNA pseudouridine38-40 synthase